jgi:hypothetical protein
MVLCDCFFPSVAPQVVLPLKGKKEKDVTTKIRQSVIAKLDKDGKLSEKTGDLDDLIKQRNDLDVDELIRNNQASMEQLDSLIECARTLIAKNTKVIRRCEHFRWGSHDELTYQRIEIDRVDVKSSDEIDGGSLVSFKTTPRRETKSFGIPAKIPSDLTDIIVQKHGFAGLPDYELFLERCLLLNNDVLKPFLFVLREHLKIIQAFYNEIDAWLRAPDAERHLLEQIFDIDFEIDPSSVTPGEYDKKEDSTQASTVNSDFSLSGEDSTCLSALEEPHDDSSSSDDEKPAVLKKNVDLAPYTKTKRAMADKELVLQELAADGQYTLSFHIAQGGQKEKLVKFIEFLEN